MPNALGKGVSDAPCGQGCCPRHYVFDSFQKFRRVKRLRQKVHIGKQAPGDIWPILLQLVQT